MEQQLDASHLRPGFVSKTLALSAAAIGIGIGFLLAAYGVSLFWRPIPTAIDIRIANPELTVKQEKPFVMAPPDVLRIDPRTFINRPDQASNSGHPNHVAD